MFRCISSAGDVTVISSSPTTGLTRTWQPRRHHSLLRRLYATSTDPSRQQQQNIARWSLLMRQKEKPFCSPNHLVNSRQKQPPISSSGCSVSHPSLYPLQKCPPVHLSPVLQGTERTARRKNVKIVYWPNVLATSLVMSSAIGQNQSMPDQIIHCWLCEVSCWLRAAISWLSRGPRCLCYTWASKNTINRIFTENSLDDICQHCSVNLCRQNTSHSCMWIKIWQPDSMQKHRCAPQGSSVLSNISHRRHIPIQSL